MTKNTKNAAQELNEMLESAKGNISLSQLISSLRRIDEITETEPGDMTEHEKGSLYFFNHMYTRDPIFKLVARTFLMTASAAGANENPEANMRELHGILLFMKKHFDEKQEIPMGGNN
jgi:hypothetical protein